jgi:hypothetical protein
MRHKLRRQCLSKPASRRRLTCSRLAKGAPSSAGAKSASKGTPSARAKCSTPPKGRCRSLAEGRGGRGTKRAPATKCAGCAEGCPRAAECSGSRCTKTAESCKWARVQISGLQRGSANTLTKQGLRFRPTNQCLQFLPHANKWRATCSCCRCAKGGGLCGLSKRPPSTEGPPPRRAKCPPKTRCRRCAESRQGEPTRLRLLPARVVVLHAALLEGIVQVRRHRRNCHVQSFRGAVAVGRTIGAGGLGLICSHGAEAAEAAAGSQLAKATKLTKAHGLCAVRPGPGFFFWCNF